VISWLEHEHSGKTELEYQLLGEEVPEQPQPLGELRKLRRFNFTHLPYSGGLMNQPHRYMQEIHICIEAELEVVERRRAARKLAERFQKTAGSQNVFGG
jgi:hypothetical protein